MRLQYFKGTFNQRNFEDEFVKRVLKPYLLYRKHRGKLEENLDFDSGIDSNFSRKKNTNSKLYQGKKLSQK